MANKELLNKKHFCILPWTHIHTWPNGNAYMCCGADFSKPLGNLNQQSLLELWNSEKMKSNRLQMLNDEYIPECYRCYEIEETGGVSLRKNSNIDFAHHLDMIDKTNADGSVDELNLPYVDFRFSNFCNLRCRTCGPDLSSKWAIDIAKLANKSKQEIKPNVIKQRDSVEIFWEQIEYVLPTIETVYFAGGEPLIMEEHYRFLDLLLEHNMTHVKLSYNTNFTNLTYKGKHISEYWNKFKDITVGASLDSWGSRAEYIRKDLTWSKIEDNFISLREKSPHVKIFIAITLSVFNFATLVEYYDYMIDNKLIDHSSMNINIVTDPVWYKPTFLPIEFRSKIAEKYKEKLNYLQQNNLCPELFLERWQMAINYILSDYEPENLQMFINATKTIDALRQENFTDVFPELRFIFDE